MRKYNTTNLMPRTRLSPNEASWIYNGLDCCLTLELFNEFVDQLSQEPENVQETYATALRKVPPILFMNMDGILVDTAAKSRVLAELKNELSRIQKNFDRICEETLGYKVNPGSPTQMQRLFYDVFQMPKKRKRNAHGNFVPTVNAEALESFFLHVNVQVYARYVLAIREIRKKIGFLNSEIDSDNRMRTQLNITGTVTGRLNSKFAATGSGTNLQNVENRMREMFIPDPGYIFVNVDLEQADSRNLGAIIWNVFYEKFGPERAGRYLDACESGDLHTTVCAMAWRELAWPDPFSAVDARPIADQIFYRHYSYRDMAKRLGHGTNFYGKPFTMAVHTKTDQPIIETFQARYFGAFPLIGNVQKNLNNDDWHGWVYRQLRDVGYLNNLFGRRRFFHNRYTEEKTLRDAIAYAPQSSTGEFLDRGWLRLWDHMPEAVFRIPVHDSIMFQLPLEGIDELMPKAVELLKVEIELAAGRRFSIPLEAKTGFNWRDAKYDKKTEMWSNPYGLKAWTGKEEREAPKRGFSLRAAGLR